MPMSEPHSAALRQAARPSVPPGPLDWRQLVQWLQSDGVISAEEAQRTVARCSQAESAQPPLVRLANVGMARASDGRSMDSEELTQYLAGRCGLAYLRIDPLRVDVGRVGEIMSASYAERHKVLPVQVTPQEVVVATAEPFMDDWVAEVERQARRTVRRVVANPQDIKRYTAEFFALAKSVRAAEKAGGASAAASFEQLVELGNTSKQLDANDQGVVRVVDWLWQYAFDQRASDIHLEPRREQGVIRFRIDGVLRTILQPNKKLAALLISRIKVMARLDIAEKRIPQDGRISLRIGRRNIDVRVSTLPSIYGERAVLRLLDKNSLQLSLNNLGMTAADKQDLENLIQLPHGIILVTGPTGSGKSTTLYAILSALNTPGRNILTVEDPVEYELEGIGQTQVNTRVDMSFARGLRAILRQDPDVVMVGEIRDTETAQIAVQASLTGHLVLSTLHTNSASGAVTRLRDMGVESFLLSSSLAGIIAQRLVRRLCPQCRQFTPVSPQQAQMFKYHQLAVTTIGTPVGCPHCHQSGYQGRMAIHEMMVVTPELRAAIHENVDEQALERLVRQQHKALIKNGLQKVISGQ